MGAHVWVRDGSKQAGGKAYVSGAYKPPQQAPPPPKRIKRTWTRDAASTEVTAERPLPGPPGEAAPQGERAPPSAPASGGANTETAASTRASSGSGPGPAAPTRPPVSAQRPAVPATTRPTAKQTTAPAAAASAAQREVERLKAALAAAEQKKKEAAAQKGRDAERERAERKRRLEAGFQQFYEAARQQAALDIQAERAARGGARLSFADDKEVDRVLKAGSDYQVLQLEPGASAAEAKKRYRQMAIALHPDKCDVPRAGEAFHRVVTAYRSISSFL